MKEKRTHLGDGGEEENTRSSVQTEKLHLFGGRPQWMHLVYSGRAWHEQLKELLTGIHGHQKKTLADLSCWASARSGCAVMQRVAETLSERGLSEARDEQHRAAPGMLHCQ